MEFSPLGLVLSLAVLAPNLLLLVVPPRGAAPSPVVPLPLSVVERIAQGACVVVPAITPAGTLNTVAGIGAALAVGAYGAGWIRYASTGRRWSALYGSWGPIPVPMAVLPAVAFVLGGLWLSNPWVIGAGALLAAGHIPSAILIARALRDRAA